MPFDDRGTDEVVELLAQDASVQDEFDRTATALRNHFKQEQLVADAIGISRATWDRWRGQPAEQRKVDEMRAALNVATAVEAQESGTELHADLEKLPEPVRMLTVDYLQAEELASLRDRKQSDKAFRNLIAKVAWVKEHCPVEMHPELIAVRAASTLGLRDVEGARDAYEQASNLADDLGKPLLKFHYGLSRQFLTARLAWRRRTTCAWEDVKVELVSVLRDVAVAPPPEGTGKKHILQRFLILIMLSSMSKDLDAFVKWTRALMLDPAFNANLPLAKRRIRDEVTAKRYVEDEYQAAIDGNWLRSVMEYGRHNLPN